MHSIKLCGFVAVLLLSRTVRAIAARVASRAPWGSAWAAQTARRSPQEVARDRKALTMTSLALGLPCDFWPGTGPGTCHCGRRCYGGCCYPLRAPEGALGRAERAAEAALLPLRAPPTAMRSGLRPLAGCRKGLRDVGRDLWFTRAEYVRLFG